MQTFHSSLAFARISLLLLKNIIDLKENILNETFNITTININLVSITTDSVMTLIIII